MSLTIASVNVNGIRAATKIRNEDNPGMLAWLTETPADVVLMQEVRATEKQSREALAPALEQGWHLAVAPAEEASAEVAEGLVGDTVNTILSQSQGGTISIGLLISLWAGSSAMVSARYSKPPSSQPSATVFIEQRPW